MRVCVGDVEQDGIVSVLPVRSVPKTSSTNNDDVHPQVPIFSERLAALHLVWNSDPLQHAGARMEKWLALVHLRPGSGTDACVPGVSTTASQQRHLIATCSSIPMQRLPMPTNSAAGMTRKESVGLVRKHAVAPAPCRLLQ